MFEQHVRRLFEDVLKVVCPEALIRLLKQFILQILVAHWMGCLFFLITQVWDMPSESWIVFNGLHKLSILDQYLFALTKALYMMIGGEDMLPSGFTSNKNCDDLRSDYCRMETWTTLCCLYIGNLFYAVVISVFATIVRQV